MGDFLEVVLTEDLKFGGLWSSQDIAILSTAKYLRYLRNAGRIRTSEYTVMVNDRVVGDCAVNQWAATQEELDMPW